MYRSEHFTLQCMTRRSSSARERADVDNEARSVSRSGKRTNAELERALRAAEKIHRVRDEFFRIAGHELRSPLTALQLQTDTLTTLAVQGGEAAEFEERAGRIRRSLNRLTWLIEEVLDLGRASGGGLRLHLVHADMAEIARRAIERFAVELRRAGCEPTLAESGPVAGIWDAARVEHSVGTLLLAAMKSGAGAPIAIEVTAAAGEGPGAVVAVRDGGPGLPAGQRALVFGSFEELMAGLQPGSPVLALWLARAVAEAHGGDLVLGPGRAVLRLSETGSRPPGPMGEEADPQGVRAVRRRRTGARRGRRARAP
jgi:signal transduction histidine kinase